MGAAMKRQKVFVLTAYGCEWAEAMAVALTAKAAEALSKELQAFVASVKEVDFDREDWSKQLDRREKRLRRGPHGIDCFMLSSGGDGVAIHEVVMYQPTQKEST